MILPEAADDFVSKPFIYHHLGSLAYIGNAAVFDFGKYSFMGGLVSPLGPSESSSRLTVVPSATVGHVRLEIYLLQRASEQQDKGASHGGLDHSWHLGTGFVEVVKNPGQLSRFDHRRSNRLGPGNEIS